MMVAALLAATCAPSLREGIRVRPGGVLFQVKRTAGSVAVAGDFNGWSTTAHPMARGSGDFWSRVIPLPPGEHLFMYVVDGREWVTPKEAPELAPDGFGGVNGKVSVP